MTRRVMTLVLGATALLLMGASMLPPQPMMTRPAVKIGKSPDVVPGAPFYQCGTNKLPFHSYRLPDNSFGPALPDSFEGAHKAILGKICGTDRYGPDPVFFAAVWAVVIGGSPNQKLTRAQWSARAPYLYRFLLFKQVVTGEPKCVFSTAMIQGEHGWPQIRVIRKCEPESHYAVMHAVGGFGPIRVLVFRLECGGQLTFWLDGEGSNNKLPQQFRKLLLDF